MCLDYNFHETGYVADSCTENLDYGKCSIKEATWGGGEGGEGLDCTSGVNLFMGISI